MPVRQNELVGLNQDILMFHQMELLQNMARGNNLRQQNRLLDNQVQQLQKEDFEEGYKKYLNTPSYLETKKPVEDENNIYINIDYTCNTLAMKEINGKYGGEVVKTEDKEFIYDNQYEEEFMELYDKYYDILYQIKKPL